ncbi:hypothetical protein INR49_003980 [Caranx melampygus]|nr:hypothetical protein INR49_003980 [Caranx melampygus]
MTLNLTVICYLQQTVHRSVSCTVGDIGLCSVLQEDVDDPGAAVCTGVVEGGVPLPASCSGVSSCIQQHLNHTEVAARLGRPLGSGACGVQWGLALLVCGQHVCTVAQEKLHVLHQASPRRNVQRGAEVERSAAVCSQQLRICSMRQQQPDAGAVASYAGVMECGPAPGVGIHLSSTKQQLLHASCVSSAGGQT